MSDGIPAEAGFRHSKTQNNLDGTLETLGERESGTARLKEAVTALREALRERTRAHAAGLGHDPEESRQCVPNPR